MTKLRTVLCLAVAVAAISACSSSGNSASGLPGLGGSSDEGTLDGTGARLTIAGETTDIKSINCVPSLGGQHETVLGGGEPQDTGGAQYRADIDQSGAPAVVSMTIDTHVNVDPNTRKLSPDAKDYFVSQTDAQVTRTGNNYTFSGSAQQRDASEINPVGEKVPFKLQVNCP